MNFLVDLDIEGFINDISKLNSLQVRKQIPIIVPQRTQGAIEKKKLTKKELVLDKIGLYPDEANKALAALCKCHESYISKIRKEMINSDSNNS